MDVSCFSKRAYLCINSTGIHWNESTLKQVTPAVEENQPMKPKRFKSGPSRGEHTRNFHWEEWFTSGALYYCRLYLCLGHCGSSNRPLWQLQQATPGVVIIRQGLWWTHTGRFVLHFRGALLQFNFPSRFTFWINFTTTILCSVGKKTRGAKKKVRTKKGESKK